MKKEYQKIELVLILLAEDVVRTSQNDNVGELSSDDFPEIFEKP